jgi:TM2 domain-containing membrane protein YozV
MRQTGTQEKPCPIFLVKLFSLIPGLGHIYAGFYLKGGFWFLLAVPVIAAFIYVLIDVGSVAYVVLYALGGIYAVLVYCCIREVGRNIGDTCNTKEFINYFEREKKIDAKYKLFLQRQYDKKLEDADSISAKKQTKSNSTYLKRQ